MSIELLVRNLRALAIATHKDYNFDGKDANRAEKPLLSEQIDDLGNIKFNAVPIGDYIMIVHLPEGEPVIEGLNIQPC